MSGTSLGLTAVLVLLAFVGWTGYRAASLGGTCLGLAGAGLVLQQTVGWMPADRAELLSYQLGAVVVAAAVAIPLGLRHRPGGLGAVVVAVVLAVASFGIAGFAGVEPLARVVLGALAAVLLVIALHVFVDLRVLRPYAATGTYLPTRRLWRAAALTASAGVMVNTASLLAPWLWLALGLLFLSFAGFVVAVQLAAFAVVLVRNGPFARAWARPWSRTRQVATVDLVRWAASAVGALTLLGVPVTLSDVVRAPAPVTVVLLVAGAACVVAGGVTLRSLLDHVAAHRYRTAAPVGPEAASGLRGLMESEPVYRLLPGMTRRE
ncbi:hypothetical protein [Plantactinospora sp. WMMB782]|uniref:hypothetical protein n=1 Tax=Plantactinospora sp. WMMB782 TaxID=3404121 RepID=UPI003B96299E